MTDTALGQPKAALGVGSLIGESFSIFFGHFLQIVILALVPIVLGRVVAGLLIGFDVSLDIEQPQFSGAGSVALFVASFIVKMMAGYIAGALLIQLAYDAKLQRPVQPGRYFGPTLSTFLPLAVLSTAAAILVAVGLFLLVVPGLWLNAVFYVMGPAIIIERVGFGGLGRSASLTRQYRWPIVGLVALTSIFIVALGIATEFMTKLVVAFGGIPLGIFFSAAISSIGAGLAGVLVALVYARLREIKEGVSVDQIAAVFD